VRITFDTNVLVYAEGANGPDLRQIALSVIKGTRNSQQFVPIQVLSETFNVLTKKGGFSRREAQATLHAWSRVFHVLATTIEDFETASELSASHNLQIYDAIILAVSDAAGCRILLSEDMQHGFEWRGVTVINPFLAEPHPLLRRAFGS